MKLDSAVFYSNDLNRVEDFYSNVMGLRLDSKQEGRFISFMLDGGVRLGIKKTVEEREVPGAQTVFIGVEDIEETYAWAKESGVDILKPLSYLEGFGSNFSILDPDKNKLQFVQREG